MLMIFTSVRTAAAHLLTLMFTSKRGVEGNVLQTAKLILSHLLLSHLLQWNTRQDSLARSTRPLLIDGCPDRRVDPGQRSPLVLTVAAVSAGHEQDLVSHTARQPTRTAMTRSVASQRPGRSTAPWGAVRFIR